MESLPLLSEGRPGGSSPYVATNDSGSPRPSRQPYLGWMAMGRHALSSLGALCVGFATTVRQRQSFTRQQRATMSPFEKCRYGRIPLKLILNLLLVTFVSTRVLLESTQLAAYTAQQHETFNRMFNAEPHVYTVEQLQSTLNTSMTYFCALPGDSVDSYALMGNPLNCTAQMHLEKYTNRAPFTTGSHANLRKESFTYTLTLDEPLGPFNWTEPVDENPAARQYMDDLAELSVTYLVHGLLDDHTGFIFVDWQVTQRFGVSVGGGAYPISVVVYRQLRSTVVPYVVLDFLILFLSLWSLVLTILSIMRASSVYLYVRDRLRQQTRDGVAVWSTVSFTDRRSFFNLWHFSSAIGDVLLVISSLLALPYINTDDLGRPQLDNATNITRALAIFLSWTNLLRFLQWSTQFYVLVLTVASSLTRSARCIVATIPLFVGYALAGVVVFASYAPSLFGSLDQAAVTLYAILNGDSILDAFKQLNAADQSGIRVFARIYLYSFSAIFITCVLNVFIFLISDSYELAKELELRMVHGEKRERERLVLMVDRVRRLLALADRGGACAMQAAAIPTVVVTTEDDDSHDSDDDMARRSMYADYADTTDAAGHGGPSHEQPGRAHRYSHDDALSLTGRSRSGSAESDRESLLSVSPRLAFSRERTLAADVSDHPQLRGLIKPHATVDQLSHEVAGLRREITELKELVRSLVKHK